jgi:hypothetical protein
MVQTGSRQSAREGGREREREREREAATCIDSGRRASNGVKHAWRSYSFSFGMSIFLVRQQVEREIGVSSTLVLAVRDIHTQ